MGTHSSIPAWRISWTEEPSGCSPQCHTESEKIEANKKKNKKKKKKTEATYYVTAYHFKNVLLVLKCILKTCGPLLSK